MSLSAEAAPITLTQTSSNNVYLQAREMSSGAP